MIELFLLKAWRRRSLHWPNMKYDHWLSGASTAEENFEISYLVSEANYAFLFDEEAWGACS